MTSDGRGEDRAEEYADDIVASRKDWFAHELGTAWVPQGDGTYRFVGAEAPVAEAAPPGEERAPADPVDAPLSRESRFSFLYRRRR